jgi:hypothetical protein
MTVMVGQSVIASVGFEEYNLVPATLVPFM